jgi:uncharacterized protein (TIGR02266 family)
MGKERRRTMRVPVQMFVEESPVSSEGPEATYFQRSSNLSPSGMFLENTVPHPVGTRVALQFTLPGENSPIRVQAEIVSALEGEEHMGMGLRFVNPPAEVQTRITAFIAQHEPK